MGIPILVRRHLYIGSQIISMYTHEQLPVQWRHMNSITPQTASDWTVCSIATSCWQQNKHQSSALLAVCVRGTTTPGPVMRKVFPCDEAIMTLFWCKCPCNTSVLEWYAYSFLFPENIAPNSLQIFSFSQVILLLFCRWVERLDLINFIKVTQWVRLKVQLLSNL